MIRVPPGPLTFYFSGGPELSRELHRLLPRPPLPLKEYVESSEPTSLVILEWQQSEEQASWLERHHRASLFFCLPAGATLPASVRENPQAAIFLFPFDVSEIGRSLGLAPPLDPEEIAARVWLRNLHLVHQSVEAIAGQDPFLARVHAHRLAGSLGSFGLPQGSEVARSIELSLIEGNPERVPILLESLRRIIEQGPPSQRVRGVDEDQGRLPMLLLLRQPEQYLDLLQGLEVRPLLALDLAQAKQMALDWSPEISLVEHSHPDFPAWMEFMRENPALNQDHAGILVCTDQPIPERQLLSQAGFRSWLRHPSGTVGGRGLRQEIERQLEWRNAQKFHVLVVDDDLVVLSALRQLLNGRRIHVTTLKDPVKFWVERHRYQPDLLILDVEMPRLSGYELCRGLRGDPQYEDRAILILTAHNDPETIARLFRAGADDFVPKPFIGPELSSRVEARLERFRLLRALIETDPLTGLVNRRKALQSLERYLKMAQRQKQPLSLALIDIDHFKAVNDNYGHFQGDQVLLRLGAMLKEWFRGEDVVCRWGGEEFLVGMFGMGEEHAVVRLGLLLEDLRLKGLGKEFSFPISFSAGIAECPVDGEQLNSCLQVADDRLYQAKRSGRQRVRGHLRPFRLHSQDAQFVLDWSERLVRFSWLASDQGPVLQDAADPVRPEGALCLAKQDTIQTALALLRTSRPADPEIIHEPEPKESQSSLRTLLLIEDTSEIRLLVGLGLDNWEVWEAESGEQALRLLAANKPDVVLLDSQLEDGSAELFIERIREGYHGPILWFSSSPLPPIIKNEVLGTITKPFDPLTLADGIEAILEL